MRLGGPILIEEPSPEQWIAGLKNAGYGAAYFPVDAESDPDMIRALEDSARRANILIAEVGAWCNPLDPDESTRKAALEKCKRQLALADEVGARCCVNISGSRGTPWDGPHPLNLTDETFDLVVQSVREIIDAVRPERTYYTLEPMPWMYPDSADSYLRLISAIERTSFGVHVDMVNVVNSPQAYFGNTELIREWFTKLGKYIRSTHAKDTLLSERMTTHIDEVRPGLGTLDYQTLLTEMDGLDPDVPLMMEHLDTDEEYRLAAAFIREVASEVGLVFR